MSKHGERFGAIARVFAYLAAMLGACIVVPSICNLSISTTLLFAGIGTLFYAAFTKGAKLVYMGAGFAFIGVLQHFMANPDNPLVIGSAAWNQELGKVVGGFIAVAIVYFIFSAIVRFYGVKAIKAIFNPIIVGVSLMIIGISIVPILFGEGMLNDYQTGGSKIWIVIIVTIVTIVAAQVLSLGVVRSTSVIMGVFVGYITALALGLVSFEPLKQAEWFMFGESARDVHFGFLSEIKFSAVHVISILPIGLILALEQIYSDTKSDINSNEENKRVSASLFAQSFSVALSGCVGGTAVFPYGGEEKLYSLPKNTHLNRVCIAAFLLIPLALIGKAEGLLATIPDAVFFGAAVVIAGMLIVRGLNIILNSSLNLKRMRHLILMGIMISLGVGLEVSTTRLTISSVRVSGVAVAIIAGILLNVVFAVIDKFKGVRHGTFAEEDEQYFDVSD